MTAAKKAGVLEEKDLERVADFLKAIKPMPAVFDNQVRHTHQRHERQEGKDQARSRRAAAAGHSRFQVEEQLDRS